MAKLNMKDRAKVTGMAEQMAMAGVKKTKAKNDMPPRMKMKKKDK